MRKILKIFPLFIVIWVMNKTAPKTFKIEKFNYKYWSLYDGYIIAKNPLCETKAKSL